MALSTCRNPFQTPSLEPLAGKEVTITRKCRFFDALARDKGIKSMRSIAIDIGILEAYNRKWKEQCEKLSPLAKRKTRQRSQVLGRKLKVIKLMCKKLCSPSRNLVKKQLYKAQIAFYKILVKRR
jgi:hypothetical protein